MYSKISLIFIVIILLLVNNCKETSTDPQESDHEIEIEYPNGGEIFSSGDRITCNWSSSSDLGTYNLFYQKDTDSDWEIIQTNISDTIYSWLLPELSSDKLRCKVEQVISSSLQIEDISDSAFSIFDEKLVLKNNLRDKIVFDSLEIIWSSNGMENIDIEYSSDGGDSWVTLEKNYDAGKNFYVWFPQDISSSQVIIALSYISKVDNSAKKIKSALFRIVSKEELHNAIQLYPLKLNNMWLYEVDASLQSWATSDLKEEECQFTYLLKSNISNYVYFDSIDFFKITNEVVFPDTIYKIHHAIENQPIGGWYSAQWLGVDTNNSKVYHYRSSIPSKTVIYNLLMNLNDKFDIDLNWEFSDMTVKEVGVDYILDYYREYKVFKMTHAYFETEYKYVSGIGIYSGNVTEEYANGIFRLKGCVIDNVVYGDTSITQ